MRVLVYGGRWFDDAEWLERELDHLHEQVPITCIIEGEASGADSLAREWAKKRRIPFDPFPAAWDDLSHPDAVIKTNRMGKKYDAKAGFRRNQKMIDVGKPELAVEFPGNSGTADMRQRVNKAKIRLWLAQI